MERIKYILKNNPKGLTIEEVSKKLSLNRATAAKYLNSLVMSGQADLRELGRAKLFYLTQRLPLINLLSLATDLILILDKDLFIQEANEPFLAFFKVSKEEIKGRQLEQSSLSPYFTEEHIATLKQALDGSGSTSDIRIEGTGEYRYFRIKFIPLVFEEGGRAVGITFEDITEMKRYQQDLERRVMERTKELEITNVALEKQIQEHLRAQDALKRSEKEYRRIVDTAYEGICQTDADFNITYVNRRMTEMLGYTAEEVMGRDVTSFMAEEDLPDQMIRLKERLQGRNDRYELRLITKDGSIRWMQVSATPLMDPQGTFTGFFAMCSDITERKIAEIEVARRNEELQTAYKQQILADEELQQNFDELAKSQLLLLESEERYRNVVEDQTEFICRFLPDGTHVFVNDAYCRYFGLKREDILGHKFRPTIPDEDRERLRRFFESLTPGHPVDTIEHRIIMPDGSIRWQWWSDRAIFDNAGHLREYQSVGRDITEQKTLENTLRVNQIILTEAMNLAHMANWEFDDRTDMFTFNDRFYALYGTTAEREGGYQMPMDVYFREFVHPDDRDRITMAVKRGREISGPQDVSELEHRIIRRDGEIRYIVVRVQRITANDNYIIKIHGVNQDMTARKWIEEALRESEEKYRDLVETANCIILKWDKAGTITFVNKYAERFFGYHRDEIIGKPIMGTIVPATESGSEKDLHQMIDDIIRHPENYIINENENITRDGRRVRIQWHNKPIFDENGKFAGLLSIGSDLTARKWADEEISR